MKEEKKRDKLVDSNSYRIANNNGKKQKQRDKSLNKKKRRNKKNEKIYINTQIVSLTERAPGDK